MAEVDSHRRGDLTELLVAAELKKRGIAVSEPIGNNERYDLVLEQPSGALLRAQVKTGRLKDGTIRFKGVSQHTNSAGHVYKPYGNDIDCFLVYCYDTDQTFLLNSNEVGTKMYLRVEEPKKRTSQVNWADQHLLSNR